MSRQSVMNTPLLASLLAAASLFSSPAIGFEAQAPEPAGRSFAALRGQVRQHSAPSTVVQVEWLQPAVSAPALSAPQSRPTTFRTNLRRLPRLSRLPVDRRPELAADSLVVVLESSDGRELDWRIVIDPRMARAEALGPDGVLTGHHFDVPERPLSVLVPAHPDGHSLRIYQSRWNGSEYVLDAIGIAPLGGAR